MSSFEQTCFDIWQSNYDRKDINNIFKPVCAKYIGVEDATKYDNILKTYLTKFEQNNDTCVVFDGEIPFQAEFDLINYVLNELNTMNIQDLENQDIVLFDDIERNKIFLRALQYIVNLAIEQENFFNNNIRNNFITKQILWSFLYIKNLKKDREKTNKCLYYGKITKHEVYFLLLLSKMNFDVIYINPLKEENWEVDHDKCFVTYKNQQIIPIETLKLKTAKANVMVVEESVSSKLQRDIQQELFTNTGVFRPWQFRSYNPVSLYLKSTIYDLNSSWNEPSRLRQGFKIENNDIYIPNFFQQIDGVYENLEDYKELVLKCVNSRDTLFINNDGSYLLHYNSNENDKYKLIFAQLNDGSFDINQIKQMSFYNFSGYKIEIQNLILNKINECILDKQLFTNPFNKDKVLDFIMLILNLDLSIIKLIDGFDYPQEVPKIVVFLDNNMTLSNDFMLLLAFLQKMSFDIIIFNPAGLFDARNVINTTTIDSVRLDDVNYELTFETLKHYKKKKGLFKSKRR